MANTMPYNLEAEQSILACILIDQEKQFEIIANLKSDDFLVEKHKIIFKCMQTLSSQNDVIDIVTVTDLLQKGGNLESVGGLTYLTELTNILPSSANYEQYLEIVSRDGVLRRLINSSNEIIKDCSKSTDSKKSLQNAEKLIFDISERSSKSGLEQIGNYFGNVIEKFEKLSKDKKYTTGLKTGFKNLDYMTNGLHPGNLIILAARPSVGKTTFAMNIVENVALRSDAVVAVFALEMTKEELAQRMLCSVGNINMDKALKGKLAEDNDSFKKIYNTNKLLSKVKIFVDETTGQTPQMILSKCRRLKMLNNGRLDLVVIDHIQLMESAKKNIDSRQQEVTDISKNLKSIAKELQVPVLALSQLSRQVTSRKSGEPILSDLRESGSIEQDADVVMFLHRPEMDGTPDAQKKANGGMTKVLIAKNRNGKIGNFEVLFKGEYVKFIDVVQASNLPTPPADNSQNDNMNEEVQYDDNVGFSAEDLDSLVQGGIPQDEDEGLY